MRYFPDESVEFLYDPHRMVAQEPSIHQGLCRFGVCGIPGPKIRTRGAQPSELRPKADGPTAGGHEAVISRPLASLPSDASPASVSATTITVIASTPG